MQKKDIDSNKNHNNNLLINCPKITLKTVLSSIQYFNKYKSKKPTKNKRIEKENLNKGKSSVNNNKDNFKNNDNNKQGSNNNSDDNGNNSINNIIKPYLYNENHYINETLILNVKNKEKINPDDTKLFHITKDGNCLLRE